MERRTFLKLSSVAGLVAFSPSLTALESTQGRVLVLVELKGGNDGLNTVIPTEDDLYYRLRPSLGIKANQAVRLSNGPAIHPALKPLQPLWSAGELAVVEGVGYAKPNRSHFRSIEIWETGSDSGEYLQNGWMSRAFPQGLGKLPGGLVAGRGEDGPLRGARAITVESPEQLFEHGRRLRKVSHTTPNPALAHVVGTQNDLVDSIHAIENRVGSTPPMKGEFSRSELGRGLHMTAQMLAAGVPLTVVKVQLTGFDTHTQQERKHARLLGDLAQNLAAFRDSMRATGNWGQIAVATYSEFGRRAAENGARGTDHGTASPLFVMGGKIRGGRYGKSPALDDLDQGDLKFTTDYRRVYTTLSTRWLHGASLGGEPLGFL